MSDAGEIAWKSLGSSDSGASGRSFTSLVAFEMYLCSSIRFGVHREWSVTFVRVRLNTLIKHTHYPFWHRLLRGYMEEQIPKTNTFAKARLQFFWFKKIGKKVRRCFESRAIVGIYIRNRPSYSIIACLRSKSPDWLEKSQPSKKATFVLIM